MHSCVHPKKGTLIVHYIIGSVEDTEVHQSCFSKHAKQCQNKTTYLIDSLKLKLDSKKKKGM